MEAVRELMYEAIDIHGLGSKEALEASRKMDKHIEVAQRQRKLTKEEVKTKYINYLNKNKQAVKNEADCYIWEKGKRIGTRVAKHRQRQPHWRSK